MVRLLFIALLLWAAPAWAGVIQIDSGTMFLFGGIIREDSAAFTLYSGNELILNTLVSQHTGESACVWCAGPSGILAGAWDSFVPGTFGASVPLTRNSSDFMGVMVPIPAVGGTYSAPFTMTGQIGDTTLTGSGTVTISMYLEQAAGYTDPAYAFWFTRSNAFVFAGGPVPAPEPATWILLGSGVLALAFTRRKRAGGHQSGPGEGV